MSREARFWRRLLVWAIVLALLAGALYLVETAGSDCEDHGGTYDMATGCSTPSGNRIPR